MKGIVFNIFSELVETKFGLEVLDKILEKVPSDSDGVYTAAATYSDDELFALVGALSEEVNIPVPDLVQAYGEFMFPKLVSKYPVFIKDGMTLKAFLLTVHDVIHIEVKKLYDSPSLPDFEYEDSEDGKLVMIYQSPRKLCHLSLGLIHGAAAHFNTAVSINHATCMHDGADSCRLELTFG